MHLRLKLGYAALIMGACASGAPADLQSVALATKPVLDVACLETRPTFIVSTSDHPMLLGEGGLTGDDMTRHGRALVDTDGAYKVYINRILLRHPIILRRAIVHEVAHLAAWEAYGDAIAEHGPEYMKTLQALKGRLHDDRRDTC